MVEVLILGIVTSARRVGFVVYMPRWPFRTDDLLFNFIYVKVNYARLVMIDPNDCMTMLAHNALNWILSCRSQYIVRAAEIEIRHLIYQDRSSACATHPSPPGRPAPGLPFRALLVAKKLGGVGTTLQQTQGGAVHRRLTDRAR